MPRALLIYVLVLPLAILVGYMMATPTDTSSFGFVLLAFSTISIPLMLKRHHFLLVLAWNASVIVFFLPGQPELGMVLAFLSLGIALVTRTLSRERAFLSVPSVSVPLVLIIMVVLVTAKLTGGIGGRVFGAETWGAKRYLSVFGAIAGYFALIAQSVPKEKATNYLSAFLLGGVTAIVSDLIFMAGPPFYFLFVLFPSDTASMQALTQDVLMRLTGVSYACIWTYYFLLARFGIQGILDLRAPWRILLLLGVLVGTFFGGYRGLVILIAMVLFFQFFFEGIHRTRLGPILIFATVIGMLGTVSVIDRLPLSIQRAFSFLPIQNIDPAARADALATLDWRLSMWKLVLPEVPKYLFIGKGYAFNGTDYYLTQESMRRGLYPAYEDTLISGNYHNGILTLLIPVGIFGFVAFLWFCGSSVWVLMRNYRYGDPDLRLVNTFLVSYFCARLSYYFIFYGQFELDLPQFTGIVGLSIVLNQGVRSPAKLKAEQEVLEDEPELALAT
jgi:hypothetical protein